MSILTSSIAQQSQQSKLLQGKSLTKEWLGSSYYEDNSLIAGPPMSVVAH